LNGPAFNGKILIRKHWARVTGQELLGKSCGVFNKLVSREFRCRYTLLNLFNFEVTIMYKKILAAVDFSDVSQSVVAHAKHIAAMSGASVRLLHVEPHADMLSMAIPDEDERKKLSEQPGGEEYNLRKLEELLSNTKIECDHIHLNGEPTEMVLQAAKDYEADIIVIGSHGHSKLYHFLGGGGHRDSIVKESNIPVLVVKK
jgi:nucleotide-binding universal stress UspA family protein